MSAAVKSQYLTNAQILKQCPAAAGRSKAGWIKDTYEIVPTIDLVKVMRAEGWMPTKAVQIRGGRLERQETNRHMIRFRHLDAKPIVGDSFPEIVVMNSQNGACAYRMDAGLFRLVCSNGLVVSDATFEARKYRHSRGVTGEIIEGTFEVIENVKEIEDQMRRYNGLLLSQPKRIELARRAVIAVKGEDALGKYDLEVLAKPSRREDARPTLWNTFNTMQEKLIEHGAQLTRVDTGRRVSLRGISQPRVNVDANKALWETMTDYYAEVKAG